MARPADNSLTLDDLYSLPNGDCRQELSRGCLVSEPAPCMQHGRVITSIVCALGQYVESRQSGVIVTADAGFVLSRDLAST